MLVSRGWDVWISAGDEFSFPCHAKGPSVSPSAARLLVDAFRQRYRLGVVYLSVIILKIHSFPGYIVVDG
jgi:hypothetical protein